MKIDRLDLDGLGSPAALAKKIHGLVPDMPAEVPLEQLCRQLDIVSIEEIATESFEAALLMDELKAGGMILLAAGRRRGRSRFSIAHELGHFLIPSHLPQAGSPFECSLEHFHLLDARSRDRRRRVEAEANRFAAHLLMPPVRIRSAIGQGPAGLEGIIAAAREFGVSKEAMARAFVEASREPVAVIVAQYGRALRRYRSEEFPWLPGEKGEGLPAGSMASHSLPSAGDYSSSEEVDAEVWLTQRDADRTLLLTEQVLSQSNGFAMILLQAEMDEDSDY